MISLDVAHQPDSSNAESFSTFAPITPNASEINNFKAPRQVPNKTIATRTMLQHAIEALSTESRKGFSFAGIRNYILQNFLHNASEVKYRMPFMKKFFKTALESGEIVSVRGNGLTGSFRVPATSSLHKNASDNKKKLENKLKNNKEKGTKRSITKLGPALKVRKIKKAKRIFSAAI